MIVVTGAAGFIGSNLITGLNRQGHTHILAVDDLSDGDKFINLQQGVISDYLDKDDFRQRVSLNSLGPVEAIFHQGACSDTTERDGRFMMDNNYRYTLELFEFAQARKIPFIYASSAAVYGAGPGYTEDIKNERPLNVYGYSKFLFDQVLRQRRAHLTAPAIGLRYFNVYGPNEQHKSRMASVAWHNMGQYRQHKPVRLFGAWDGYGAGEQERDFVYIDDVIKVNLFFAQGQAPSGIYNCGSGRAQPFNDVAKAVINGLRKQEGLNSLEQAQMVEQGLLEYIPFPDDLKGRYQSHTQASLIQLREAGYTDSFLTVEQGVEAYIQHLAQQGWLNG